MAPKKKDAGADVLQDGPAEEEEPGSGKVVFSFSAQGVKDLPGELQTLVGFSGFCKEFRTNASPEPSGWEFTKETVIRLQNQDLYNDMVERPLVVSLRDAAADNAPIGTGEISLVPLLHDATEVSLDLELKLAPDYYAKWWKDDEADDPKKKDKNKAPAEPAKEREPLFEGDAPPPTILTVSVKVEDLVGPMEDRECWTILTLGMEGVFALPEALTSLGVTSPDDFQAHPISYKAMLLGEPFGEGLLTKAAEVKESEAVDPEAPGEEKEVTQEEWREEQMRFHCCVKFASERLIRYRGKSFIEDVRKMLSTSGGVYLYFQLEEKPPVDPKKPNPPGGAELARQCSGTAWLDLRELIPPSARRVDALCRLEANAKDPEAVLESAGCFTKLTLELSYDVTPPESQDMKVHPSKLLSHSMGLGQFSASEGASVMYQEVIQRSCEAILQDCCGGTVEEAVKRMKEVGSYDEVKQNLRESIISIFRERLRKDTAAVPGKPLKGQARDDFVSSTYSYLQLTAAKVLDKQMRPDATGELAEAVAAARKEASRFARLAYEAELLGNWTRAAHLLQNRFLIQGLSLREDPVEWLSFAKFLARCRDRQQAAEEALCQAARLMGAGKETSKETALEVELFLACLVLDRGRYEEAIAVFEAKHKEDFSSPTARFYLGLALFLRCRWEESRSYLESAGKPREWFQGLPDERAVVDKLKAFRRMDAVNLHIYAEYLEQLLSFGLSSLVFTFLDQTEILPEEAVNSEVVVLVDAKASALDRNYRAALSRLEPFLATGAASHEAWMLAGECYLQLQDFDQALQALQMAVSGLEDPALYIRLGSVLLVKKRWKQARDTFLRSIQFKPTAEAWSGVAYAELRSDALGPSYEALCEANLLDNERCDVWALLCLVHLRTENWDAADQACRQCLSLTPQCDDLLVEVATELHRKDRQLSLAEACTRVALEVKDSGQGDGVLADVLASMGKAEASVLESQTALKTLVEQPDLRKVIFGKALKICQELDDKPLTEALHACQKLAEEQYTGRGKTPPLVQ